MKNDTTFVHLGEYCFCGVCIAVAFLAFQWPTGLAPWCEKCSTDLTQQSEQYSFSAEMPASSAACTHILSFSYTSFGTCTHTYTVACASVTQARTHNPMLLSVQGFFLLLLCWVHFVFICDILQ